MSRVEYHGAMSLRHGLLGLLAERPGSGWDLLKRFESSLAFVWPATQSQLYTELGKMTDEALVEVTSTARAQPQGVRDHRDRAAELKHWLVEVTPERNRRNDALLRVFFLWAVDREAARNYLMKEADAYRQFRELLLRRATRFRGTTATSTASGASRSSTDCGCCKPPRIGHAGRWTRSRLVHQTRSRSARRVTALGSTRWELLVTIVG